MTHFVAYVCFAVGGIIVGIVLHKLIVGKVVATGSEVAGWASRLRAALITDADSARNAVRTLLADIERKL